MVFSLTSKNYEKLTNFITRTSRATKGKFSSLFFFVEENKDVLFSQIRGKKKLLFLTFGQLVKEHKKELFEVLLFGLSELSSFLFQVHGNICLKKSTSLFFIFLKGPLFACRAKQKKKQKTNKEVVVAFLFASSETKETLFLHLGGK